VRHEDHQPVNISALDGLKMLDEQPMMGGNFVSPVHQNAEGGKVATRQLDRLRGPLGECVVADLRGERSLPIADKPLPFSPGGSPPPFYSSPQTSTSTKTTAQHPLGVEGATTVGEAFGVRRCRLSSIRSVRTIF